VACKYNHQNVVKLLLDSEAKVDQCCKDNQTSLFIACLHGHANIVSLLLKYGADSTILRKKYDNRFCEYYYTSPFIIACENGHTEVVKLLIDIYEETQDENSLYVACKHN
jgi:ankyrin repeat protein